MLPIIDRIWIASEGGGLTHFRYRFPCDAPALAASGSMSRNTSPRFEGAQRGTLVGMHRMIQTRCNACQWVVWCNIALFVYPSWAVLSRPLLLVPSCHTGGVIVSESTLHGRSPGGGGGKEGKGEGGEGRRDLSPKWIRIATQSVGEKQPTASISLSHPPYFLPRSAIAQRRPKIAFSNSTTSTRPSLSMASNMCNITTYFFMTDKTNF